jgi:hypothetical protein
MKSEVKSVKVPKKFFVEFRKAVRYWIDILGLKSWEVFIEFKKLNKDEFAHVVYIQDNKTATVRLTSLCKDKIELDVLQPDKRAFHEVCHLLLSPLEEMILRKKKPSMDEIEKETHAIIRSLENAIYEHYDYEGTIK